MKTRDFKKLVDTKNLKEHYARKQLFLFFTRRFHGCLASLPDQTTFDSF
jgi:hypothetical protein